MFQHRKEEREVKEGKEKKHREERRKEGKGDRGKERRKVESSEILNPSNLGTSRPFKDAACSDDKRC